MYPWRPISRIRPAVVEGGSHGEIDMLNAQFCPRVLAIVFCLVTAACAPVVIHQDPGVRDHRPPRDGEYKESYREGPCKIEREQKRDGSYKEERECKGVGPGPYRHSRGDYEEKYQDGPCKIEREWKRDGTYKEKIDCKPGRRSRD
jgi:hypothetical protein